MAYGSMKPKGKKKKKKKGNKKRCTCGM